MLMGMQMVGSAVRAQELAQHWFLCRQPPPWAELVGTGSHRHVFLDRAAGVVYKIGGLGRFGGANRQEAATLARLHAAGVAYAPPATLHRVAFVDYGETTNCEVLAMPYLPEDGSVPGPAPVFAEAGDLNPAGNVHANRGQWWLIDAGGL